MLDNVLNRLEKVRKAGRGWKARCPSHNDPEPSLHITATNDRVLLHCFGGCNIDSVLKSAGLNWSDINKEGERKHRYDPEYDY